MERNVLSRRRQELNVDNAPFLPLLTKECQSLNFTSLEAISEANLTSNACQVIRILLTSFVKFS